MLLQFFVPLQSHFHDSWHVLARPSTQFELPQKGSKFTKNRPTPYQLPACYAGVAQREGGLLRNDDFPINIKRLLDYDFLVEFFSARSRPRAPIRWRSSGFCRMRLLLRPRLRHLLLQPTSLNPHIESD
jgi:hypothetical protein